MQKQLFKSNNNQGKFYGYLVHRNTPVELRILLSKQFQIEANSSDKEILFNQYMFLLDKMTRDYIKSFPKSDFSMPENYMGTVLNIKNWSKIWGKTYLHTLKVFFDLYDGKILGFVKYLGDGNIIFKLKNCESLHLENIQGETQYKYQYDKMSERFNAISKL